MCLISCNVINFYCIADISDLLTSVFWRERNRENIIYLLINQLKWENSSKYFRAGRNIPIFPFIRSVLTTKVFPLKKKGGGRKQDFKWRMFKDHLKGKLVFTVKCFYMSSPSPRETDQILHCNRKVGPFCDHNVFLVFSPKDSERLHLP